MGKIIIIHHECEVRIEKNRPKDGRLASRGLPSGDKRYLEGRIFLFYFTQIMVSFSCSPLFLFLEIYLFILKISFQKSLNSPRCNFT